MIQQGAPPDNDRVFPGFVLAQAGRIGFSLWIESYITQPYLHYNINKALDQELVDQTYQIMVANTHNPGGTRLQVFKGTCLLEYPGVTMIKY